MLPNIVWVFADQLRGHALSSSGDANVRTPHIDAFARSGARFTAACSTYPVCVPFRFSLLTGEYAHSRWIPALDWRMSPAERTVAHELADAGYQTSYVGKWHLNGSVPPGDARAINRVPVEPGYRGGFHRWHGFNLRNGYFDTSIFHGDDPRPHPLNGYQTDRLFDIAIEELQRCSGSSPFFLVLSVEAPHPPHEAPEEYLRAVRARPRERRANVSFESPQDGVDYPANACVQSEEQLLAREVGYYAQVENLDHNYGRLLAEIDQLNLGEDTVVMFFSDHGEMLGSHGLHSKQLPFEESINIPLLIRGPSVRVGDHDDPVCTEDLYPTTLGLAGVPIPSSKPGEDLTRLLSGSETKLRRPAVYLEFVEEHRPPMVLYRRTWRGLRTRRYKYTVLDGTPWQLFDLREDPLEQRNLVAISEHRGKVAELHERLVDIARESSDSYSFTDPRAGS